MIVCIDMPDSMVGTVDDCLANETLTPLETALFDCIHSNNASGPTS